MKEPLVTIAISSYNHSNYIEDCLDSILDQEYKNLEVIICDDCSQDDTWDKIKEYQSKFFERKISCFIIRNEKNLGVTKTVNKMLKIARGEFVKDMSGDDFFLKSDCLKKYVEYMLQHLEKNIIVSNGIRVEEYCHYGKRIEGTNIYEACSDFTEGVLEKIYIQNTICAPCVMFRRNLFEKYGYYDENIIAEDWEFWLRVLSKGEDRIGFIDDRLVAYRKNANSITSVNNDKELEMRRIKLYETEKYVVEKYRSEVKEKIYAQKKMQIMLNEMIVAKGNGLDDLYHIVKKDIGEFKLWNYMSVLNMKQVILILITRRRAK